MTKKSRYDLRSVTRPPSFPGRSNSTSSLSPSPPKRIRSSAKSSIFILPEEIILKIGSYLDANSFLCLRDSCKWFLSMLNVSNAFWKLLCIKDDFSSYLDLENESNDRIGWQGDPLKIIPPKNYPSYRRFYQKGVHMRRNIRRSNFEAWRIYANSNLPVVRLTPDLDLNKVRKDMGDFSKLGGSDDLKFDWDDRYLIVIRYFGGDSEYCVIRLWDIKDEPKFLYSVEKSADCLTDKVALAGDYVVIIPSFPLDAQAVVMALDIKNEMKEVGKYIFPQEEKRQAVDEFWDSTQLKIMKNKAMVVCECPLWTLLVVDLPSCLPCMILELSNIVGESFVCQQIRSYKTVAIIHFYDKVSESRNILSVLEITDTDSTIRNTLHCNDVTDVALFGEPEEIFLLKRNGDVSIFDLKNNCEVVKIRNENETESQNDASDDDINDLEFQLFVNRHQQICVMQSSSQTKCGRYVKVYSYSEELLYIINLDLCRYGISRDESVSIYTNGAFLAAADSRRFALFNVKSGNYISSLDIPLHLEKNKGKNDKDCAFDQTGLTLFLFDENRLFAVHDHERSFPAVLDIYKFW